MNFTHSKQSDEFLLRQRQFWHQHVNCTMCISNLGSNHAQCKSQLAAPGCSTPRAFSAFFIVVRFILILSAYLMYEPNAEQYNLTSAPWIVSSFFTWGVVMFMCSWTERVPFQKCGRVNLLIVTVSSWVFHLSFPFFYFQFFNFYFDLYFTAYSAAVKIINNSDY